MERPEEANEQWAQKKRDQLLLMGKRTNEIFLDIFAEVLINYKKIDENLTEEYYLAIENTFEHLLNVNIVGSPEIEEYRKRRNIDKIDFKKHLARIGLTVEQLFGLLFRYNFGLLFKTVNKETGISILIEEILFDKFAILAYNKNLVIKSLLANLGLAYGLELILKKTEKGRIKIGLTFPEVKPVVTEKSLKWITSDELAFGGIKEREEARTKIPTGIGNFFKIKEFKLKTDLTHEERLKNKQQAVGNVIASFNPNLENKKILSTIKAAAIQEAKNMSEINQLEYNTFLIQLKALYTLVEKTLTTNVDPDMTMNLNQSETMINISKLQEEFEEENANFEILLTHIDTNAMLLELDFDPIPGPAQTTNVGPGPGPINQSRIIPEEPNDELNRLRRNPNAATRVKTESLYKAVTDEELNAQYNRAINENYTFKRKEELERYNLLKTGIYVDENDPALAELKAYLITKSEEIGAKAKELAGGGKAGTLGTILQNLVANEAKKVYTGNPQAMYGVVEQAAKKILQQSQYEIKHDKLKQDYLGVITNFDFDSDPAIVKRKNRINILYAIKKNIESLKIAQSAELEINKQIKIRAKNHFPIKIFVTLPPNTKLSKESFVRYVWNNDLEDTDTIENSLNQDRIIYEYKSPTYKSFVLRSKAYNRFIDKIINELNPRTEDIYDKGYGMLADGLENGGVAIKYMKNLTEAQQEEKEKELNEKIGKDYTFWVTRYKAKHGNAEPGEIEKVIAKEKIKKKILKGDNYEPILIKSYMIKNGPTSIELLKWYKELFPDEAVRLIKAGNGKLYHVEGTDVLTQTIPFYLMVLKKLSLELWALDNYNQILVKRKRNKFLKQDKLMVDAVTGGITK